jgi:hypothetical protein
MQLDMEQRDWTPKKPYDLRQRQHDPVIDESDELVRIVATVIRNSEGGR